MSAKLPLQTGQRLLVLHEGGGFLEVEDLAWLQGVEPADCDWKSAKISKGQFGGLVGNAMSVNILVQLLPRLLHQARLVTSREFKKMEAIACSLYGPAFGGGVAPG